MAKKQTREEAKKQTPEREQRLPVLEILAILVAGLFLGMVLGLGPLRLIPLPTSWENVDNIQATNQVLATDIAHMEATATARAAAENQVVTAAPPTATPFVQTVMGLLGIDVRASAELTRDGDLFQTPVHCEESFNQESSWLICEPGVLLDNTAAWTIPGTKEHWFINVPEGGFTNFSMGEGVISIDGVALVLPAEKGLNYEVVIRGRIDDGIVDRDLNMTAEISDFVVGHAIWSIMPPGAYVSHDWFRDQLVVSTTTGGTNCGATGCSRTRIVLFDVDSHFYQMFETHAGDIDSWTLLAAN